MLAAEATACRPSTGTSYTSIIVSSAGGVGTTSLFHALGQVVPIINDENDEDKLKHATARQLQARGLPLRYGAAPLLTACWTRRALGQPSLDGSESQAQAAVAGRAQQFALHCSRQPPRQE